MKGLGRTRGPNSACLLAARGGEEAPRGVPDAPITSCRELKGVGWASGEELWSMWCILISARVGEGVASKVVEELV